MNPNHARALEIANSVVQLENADVWRAQPSDDLQILAQGYLSLTAELAALTAAAERMADSIDFNLTGLRNDRRNIDLVIANLAETLTAYRKLKESK